MKRKSKETAKEKSNEKQQKKQQKNQKKKKKTFGTGSWKEPVRKVKIAKRILVIIFGTGFYYELVLKVTFSTGSLPQPVPKVL
jgi:hypothetical protein